MSELTVAALRADVIPAVRLDEPDGFANLHGKRPLPNARHEPRAQRVGSMPLLGRTSWFRSPLGLLASHAKRQRNPDAVACHGVTTIEVGKHESGRIGIWHDHLGDQVRKER
jgi:hypothetical protein